MSMVDVGLLGAMSDLPPEAVVAGSRAFTEFKGALFQDASACACACPKWAGLLQASAASQLLRLLPVQVFSG